MKRACIWTGIQFVAIICILLGQLGFAQDNKEWTWTNKDGRVRTKAELIRILIERNDFELGELRGANLSGANLSDVDLSGADLELAQLRGTNLSGANLIGTNLSRADIIGSNLEHADLRFAQLKNANYEPDIPPPVETIAYALGLNQLQYEKSPKSLIELRKSLLDGGFVAQARMVTTAYHRIGESVVEKMLFDWTCAWGSDWRHPLVLLVWLCLVCGPVYWAGMHFGRVGGIYQIVLDKVVATKAAAEVVTRVETGVRWVGRERLRTRSVGGAVRVRSPKLRWRLVGKALRAEWRALRLAFLFSVLSALDIGFHEFNVGVWARMLLARDFNLKARGWMRVVGGVQSLVGLGLVALSLLSYFGHPFD